ncbi:MAG: ribosomal protein S18-alanine N-acetyltransferase [Anaerolineales bacterium]|jgi:ribosomal-protein-alanine N-acetyltransferase
MADLVTDIQFIVRPMQMNDLEQVSIIDRASFSLPWPASAFRYELLHNPSSLLYVAEAFLPGGKRLVVGSIVVWMILDEAHIATIAVEPEFRGKGVSQELLATVLMDAIHKGARLATLEVRAHNVIAQSLYQHFGFIVVGRRPRYYRDNNEDALIMTVNLQQVDDHDLFYSDWIGNRDWLTDHWRI